MAAFDRGDYRQAMALAQETLAATGAAPTRREAATAILKRLRPDAAHFAVLGVCTAAFAIVWWVYA